MNTEDATRQAIPQDESELEEFVREKLAEYYRSGKPPWDTEVAPPELAALAAAMNPGRALDLGCGTGTNAVYLARHGWEVTGVDLIDGAVRQAERKAADAGLSARLLCGDVTRLDGLDVTGPYELFFDLSCYCGVPTHRRDAYADGVTRRAAPGARLLLFGYGPDVFDDGYTGVTADELRERFTGWNLIDVTPGTNPFPTAWFTLRREAGEG